MAKIQVWMEGYAATGQSAGASYHGTYEAETLKEAVEKCVADGKIEAKYVDYNRMTYWGCRFFDNGSDAVKSFG